jgi:hypothetical protein
MPRKFRQLAAMLYNLGQPILYSKTSNEQKTVAFQELKLCFLLNPLEPAQILNYVVAVLDTLHKLALLLSPSFNF